ncbi:uncharacterized protein DNG_03285 [Cephalotrichum gorgonifer]|uniref:Rab-GAP TBC domain-containing protein n=1 Tax=Cephalotrichum gorgonifer TaxID=2041049 RepID=A0AAE8STF4_9PEZI|nr:uncharacterized protein DNG_03285 [Cephalotrichum gorgonifer]
MSPEDEATRTTGTTALGAQSLLLRRRAEAQRTTHRVSKKHKASTAGEKTPPIFELGEPQREVEGGLVLPEPEYRNVAGDVRRRTDRVVRAEPPPTTQPSASQTPRRSPHNRRRPRKHLGHDGGSDSDSSDEDRNRNSGGGDDSGGVLKQRQRPPPPVTEANETFRPDKRMLEQEEEKRIRDMRIMREVEEKWGDIRDERRHCQRQGEFRRRALVRFHDRGQAKKQKYLLASLQGAPRKEVDEALEDLKAESHDPFWSKDIRNFVRRMDQQRHDYLDEALYHNMEDNFGPVTGNRPAHTWVRPTLERVEIGFLRRCKSSDTDWGLDWSKPPPTLQMHVVHVIKHMSKEYWALHVSSGSNLGVDHWMHRMTTIRSSPKEADSALALNVLVDAYIVKVRRSILRALDSDLQTQELFLEPLYKLILNSRSGNLMSTDYTEWLFKGVDDAEIEQCFVRMTAFAKFRENMKFVNMIIKHEFCPDIVKPGVVSLIMFKDTLATSTKEVSAEDLHTLGWFRSHEGEYWRFELNDNPRSKIYAPDAIFKTFLLFNDVSPAVWDHTLAETRASYEETRDHLLKFIKHPEALASLSSDPLTDEPNDELIRGEIAQDVRRLPDEPFYHQERTQTMIIDILFVYCKLNPSVGGYRQGMHELLAPIVHVVDHDAVDAAVDGMADEASSSSDSDRLMLQVLDRSFVEHDAFTLFSRIMDRAAPFYEVNDSAESADTQSSSSSVIVEKSRFIHEVCLDKVDPELAQHLTNIEILPQIFLIRWIRLLFGREFPFAQLLLFWDALFAVDPRLELIDLICVAMIIRIRWELLEADYSVCLQLLLKYPTPAPPHQPYTFVDDALYLRDHLNPSGATSLLMKYTGKMPSAVSDNQAVDTQVSMTPSFPTLGSLRARAINPRSLQSRLAQQPGGVEALLQVAAKNVLERGEKLGINQAVREAVGEIRRNVQTLQDTRPSPARFMRESFAASGAGATDEAMAILERRNKLLVGMLEESLEGLRALTAEVLEDKAKSLEMIEIAASKVQLVKSCLEDSSIDISESSYAGQDTAGAMELTPEAEEEPMAEVGASDPVRGVEGAIVPDPIPAISSLSLSDQSSDPLRPSPAPIPATTPSLIPPNPSPLQARQPPRPPKPLPTRSSIAQSSFAWMLEPEPETSKLSPNPLSTSSADPFSSPSRGSLRRKNASREKNAFLFGEVVPSGDDEKVGREGGGRREIFGLEDMNGKGAREGGILEE